MLNLAEETISLAPVAVPASALALLRSVLQNPGAEFRPGQWEAIHCLVERRQRLLVVQRTGWGKSLVYFLATRLLRNGGAGPTLIISPLLSLMRNQEMAAKRLNLRAEVINFANKDRHPEIEGAVVAGQVDVLFITPERLANAEFRERVLNRIAASVGLFVVDEAHCISDWGHDFRPDYRRIGRLLSLFPPNMPVLTTTATANNRVVEDVSRQVGGNVQVIRGPLARQSLRLQNTQLPSPAARMAWLAEKVPSLPGSGIIYTLTVRDAERLAAWLQTRGIDARAYFGDQDQNLRTHLEEALLNNELKALVATTALGMGFDKPDLGFVIHFQRPGSVVHYYQQVGRAGRAIDEAYGILLCGEEDDDIIDYFIEMAFPPAAHVDEVLRALERETGGASVPRLEQALNLSKGQIEKVLKYLEMEPQAPVQKIDSRWHVNPVVYTQDRARIEALTRLRRQEQADMREYMSWPDCLMSYLSSKLDDPVTVPCGRCASCTGRSLIPETATMPLVNEAVLFLKRSDYPIEPRLQWKAEPLAELGVKHGIPPHLQAEVGRALAMWGDAGWGELVKRGKKHDGRFDDSLVEAAVQMIRSRWNPAPAPGWVTCVPSRNHPDLVPGFADRLAARLGLPFVPSIRKVADRPAQKTMQNSFQQARNVAGAFEVDASTIRPEPCLLVDDMVDSRWTFTFLAALLRHAGSGPVFPMALALTTIGKGG